MEPLSMNSRKSVNRKVQASNSLKGKRRQNDLFKRFVTLWVLMSFILSSAPAQANRLDRQDIDRAELRQERRMERQLRREAVLSIPIIHNNQIANPVLTPVIQNRIVTPRIANLQQPRIARAELATTKREARQTLREERQQSAAQLLTARTQQTLDSGRTRNVANRLDLDLSSTRNNITLGQNIFGDSSSVTVTVGGVEKTYTVGSKVTAAEYASILQTKNGGQTLILDDQGRATSGDLNFETLTSSGDNLRLSSLVIPEQVAAIGNFSKNSDVRLKGDVTNFGSIYALANREGGTRANIMTRNLTNEQGGLISSVPNASLGSDLAPSVDLRLRADDTLSNKGTIESSGDLTLSAGKQVINGDASGRGAVSSATVIAQNNLILDAPSITNSGSMSAVNGDVNVTSPSIDGTTSGSISFNNEGGTVKALNGNINFRDASATGKPVTDIKGGDWLSKEFNIDNADGATTVDVKNLTGTLNLHSGTAHITADSADLNMGEFTVTGDPTIANTGNINITANINTNGGPLTYIAGINILIDPGVTISTANAAGAGGNLLMVAGAAFEDASTPGHIGEDWITGATGIGGGIYMNGTGSAIITSNGTTNAGNIQLVAFPSTDGTFLGEVFLQSTSITAQGGTGGSNGNISVIARGIDLGAINARGTGSTVGTGNISLNTLNPVITGGQVRVNDSTGAVISGGFTTGSALLSPEAITVGNLTSGGTTSLNSGIFITTSAINSTGNVSIISSTSTNTTSITSSGAIALSAGTSAVTTAVSGTGNVTLSTGTNLSSNGISSGANLLITTGTDVIASSINSTGSTNITAGGQVDLPVTTAASLSVASGDDIAINGSITSPGGIALVAALSIFSNATIPTISTASATGNAGDILMVAGAAFTQNAGTITITGASAAGGAIDFDFFNVGTLTSRSTAVNGAGGDITLAAFFGSANAGQVFTDATTAITTGGNGTGANGNFIAVAGRASGFGMNIGGLNTTGGTGIGGDVTLSTSTPVTTPNVVVTRSNATYTNGFTAGTVQNAGIQTAAITSRNNITITAGNQVTLGGTLTSTQGAINVSAGNFLDANVINAGTGSITLNSTGSITLNNTLTSTQGAINVAATSFVTANAINAGTGSISLLSNSTIGLNGNLTARGGILLVSGSDTFTNVSNLTLSTSGSGSSGNVTIITGATFTSNSTTATITGASAAGGGIFFANNPLTAINTTSTGANGTGGNVNLVSYAGASNIGLIFTGPATTINTGGNGTGANGNVTLVAGHTGNTAAVDVGPINTTGGLLNTGNVVISGSTPNSGIVVSRTTATPSAVFTGGAAQSGSINVRAITVNNGADVTITGGPITGTTFTGGANSVLTLTSTTGNDISFTSSNLGTATITSGRDINIATLTQGGTGITTLTAAGQLTLTGATTSGAINIRGNNLDLQGAITGSSFSAVSTLDIGLTNDITAPGGILLLAGRNIFLNSDNVVDLSTFSSTGNAGAITIVAGAAFSQTATTATITGASATGGYIDFDFNSIRNIDSRSTAANSSGGNVTMVAFNGSDGTGFVFTDPTNTVIRTGGAGTGTNGTFTAIAQAAGGDGIGIRGSLNTTGGLATTGNVYIATATPVTTTNVVVQKNSASITAGDFKNGALAASNVFVDNITVGNGASITLRSGGNITALALNAGASSALTITSTGTTSFDSTNAGTVNINAGANVFVTGAISSGLGASSLSIISGGGTQVAQITSGRINLQAGTNLFLGGPIQSATSFSGVAGNFIDLDNDITAPGGILLLAGQDIAPNSTGVDLRTASNTASAGDITIIAGAAFNTTATTVTVTGASSTGGNIDFDFVALNSIDARSTLLNGSGGDITMIAFDGATGDTGRVFTDPATSSILTGGNGTGANGNFTAIGGALNGAGVGIRGTVNLTGGQAGTGDLLAATATPNTTTNVVIQKNSASITAGNFTGGTTRPSDLFIDNVTVSNGADITLNGGLSVQTGSLTAGALSVLTINSGTFTVLGATNAGTVNITAGSTVTGSTFTQGGAGVLNITAGDTITVDQISTGNVRLISGNDLNLLNTVSATGSVSATAVRDMFINNDITAPGGILLVTGRNIFANAFGVIDFSTASATANAGAFSAIAGAAFTQNGSSVTITGASTSGGRIDFDFNNVSTINTRATAGNFSGGAVNLVAFQGADVNTGQVLTDALTNIISGGSGTGTNGNVTAVAGNSGATAIGLLGAITTTGGSGGQGNVYIAASTPDTSPNVVLSKTNAGITTGNFTTTGTNTNGNVFTGNIVVGNNAAINILTNGFGEIGSTIGGAGSSVRVSTGTSLRMLGPITTNNVALTSGTFTQLNGNITAPGGILIVAGGDVFTFIDNLAISANSSTGSAGNISIFSGAAFTQNATSVTITGASATGGRIDFDNHNLASLTANSTAVGGSGGDITLFSQFGSDNTGEIFTDATTVINAGGNGAGSNGDITFVSSKNNGSTGVVINGNINLTGGAQGTGSISLNTSAFNGPVTLNKNGAAITSGTVTGGALRNSDLFAGNLTVRGGTITARSGVGMLLGNLNVSGNVTGAGGTINLSSSSPAPLVLGGVGVNSVASLTAAGGSTSGNGGAINATNSGTGGISLAGPLNVSAAEGNGGAIALNAGSGNLDLAGNTTINASGGTTSATARNGGSIALGGNTITGAGNITLLANGVSGGLGGAISVINASGPLTIGTAASQFQAQANGANGSISFQSGGTVTVDATGTLNAQTVSLLSTTGSIVINGAVTGTSAVNLGVSGTNTITGSATVSGGTLTIAAGSGATTLNTNVATLALNGSGNVNITETDDVTLTLGNIGSGSLNLNATGDDIVVSNSFTALGGITLTTSGAGTITGAGSLISSGQLSVATGNGAVNLNTAVGSFTANTTGSVTINETDNINLNNIVASSLNVTAAGSILHGSGIIDAGTVGFTAGGDIGAQPNFIQIDHGALPVNLTASAGGNIFINIAGTGTVNLGTTTGDNVTLTAAGPINTTGNVSATAGNLNITTNTLTFANDTLSATGEVNIQSQPGSGLTLNGGTGGTITGSEINITATFGNLTLTGVQDYFGPTTLTAIAVPGAQVIVAAGADIEGHDSLTIVSDGLDEQGTLTGNPRIISNTFFTYANSIGDVNLGGNIIFQGQDLAIIARGNINITGGLTLIDLSNPAGNAGNLTMVAGYDFTPPTGGQVQSGSQFTFVPNNQSTIGGNINLTGANINLSATGGGTGGDLTAVATAGTTGAGLITMGNINTSGNIAGDVKIIGQGGINVGSISTAGTTTNGNIELSVTVPNVTGGNVLISNGTASGGTFTSTTLGGGNLSFGNVTAANNMIIRGAPAGGNTISQSGATLVASSLTVEVGNGTANLTSQVPLLNASGNGTINITNAPALQLGVLSSANNTLTLNVTSNGTITTPVGGINDVANLSLTGVGFVLNGPLTTYNSLALTASGGTNLNINNLTLTSPIVTLTSTTGNVSLTSTGVINASTSASIDAGNTFTVAGTINTQTLSLKSFDNIVNGDLTGTITAPLGTFLISTNGSIGTDANNRFISNSSQLRFEAGGGGVYVQSTATGGVDVLDLEAATEIDVLAVGPVTVNDAVSHNGDISIVQTGQGTFTVAAGANINTTEGDIYLQNLDLNRKTGKIIIDDGATIKGSGTTAGVGEVFIAMGALPVPPYTDQTRAPKGVIITETGGGGVFLGRKGIDTRKETNIALNALGRDLVFSLEGRLNRRTIHVGSNVTITADPPGDVVPLAAARGARLAASTLSLASSSAVSQLQANSMPSIGLDSNLTSGSNIDLSGANAFGSVAQLATVANLTTTLSNSAANPFFAANLATVASNSSTLSLDQRQSAYAFDALSAIYGDEAATSFCSTLEAALVSDSLPNAVRPMTVTKSAKGNALSSTHRMNNGSAVFAPAHNMTVRTPHTEIAIAADSVVLVVAGENGTSIYDLHDTKKEAITVSIQGKTLALSPGRHAMICADEKRSYADANLAELILHRGMKSARTTHGGSLFTSEFAVHSAIDCVPALRNLMASKEPTSAKVAAKLTKTQAVILTLSQNSEEFQQHVRSQITAMR
jgi:fibronectin-binding autotransporter adhesin